MLQSVNYIENLIKVKNKMELDEQPSLVTKPMPKISNFNKDKETAKKKRFSDTPNSTKINSPGVGQEWNTRPVGTASGLGDITYRESMEPKVDKYQMGTTERTGKSFTKFREAIDDPGANDMGVYGTAGGATNKEPMQTYRDQDRMGAKIKKVKSGDKNVHK